MNQVVLNPNEIELLSADQAGNVKIWDLRKDCKKKIVSLFREFLTQSNQLTHIIFDKGSHI